jgi:hypothetical protein
MVRRVTPAQLQQIIRQEEAKRRQAINRYNAEVRKRNGQIKRAVDEHNRNLRRVESDLDRYNQAVRTHNRQVEQNRRRARLELERMQQSASQTRLIVPQRSTLSLASAYERVEVSLANQDLGPRGEEFVGLAGAETANSAAATNALLGGAPAEVEIEETELTEELVVISEDLDKRWRGALYSINPQNPDAARHFCTSSREIISRIIDLKAPDQTVLEAMPGCELTGDGRVVRRAKISFLLAQSAADEETSTMCWASFVSSTTPPTARRAPSMSPRCGR